MLPDEGVQSKGLVLSVQAQMLSKASSDKVLSQKSSKRVQGKSTRKSPRHSETVGVIQQGAALIRGDARTMRGGRHQEEGGERVRWGWPPSQSAQ